MHGGRVSDRRTRRFAHVHVHVHVHGTSRRSRRRARQTPSQAPHDRRAQAGHDSEGVEAARQDSTRTKPCLALPGVTPLEWAPVGMAPFPPPPPLPSPTPIPSSLLIYLSHLFSAPF